MWLASQCLNLDEESSQSNYNMPSLQVLLTHCQLDWWLCSQHKSAFLWPQSLIHEQIHVHIFYVAASLKQCSTSPWSLPLIFYWKTLLSHFTNLPLMERAALTFYTPLSNQKNITKRLSSLLTQVQDHLRTLKSDLPESSCSSPTPYFSKSTSNHPFKTGNLGLTDQASISTSSSHQPVLPVSFLV